MNPAAVEHALEIARKSLLDLSLRNPLLNSDVNNRTRIDVVGGQSGEIYRRLVAEEKSLSFKAAAESESRAKRKGPSESPSLFDLGQPEAFDDATEGSPSKNLALQSDLNSVNLQKKLLKLQLDARTTQEERGVNILYLALGFLRWFDKPDVGNAAEKALQAPLILVPISLTRKSVNSNFRLTWDHGEVSINHSLGEKLKNNFGIDKWPELGTTESSDIEQYFQQVADAIQSEPKWIVDPNKATLAFFAFAKYLMWKDLDPQRWPKGAPITGKRLVGGVLGGGFRGEKPLFPSEGRIDGQLKPNQTTHVVDADSSQAIVIEEVRRGRDLVVQGPPGTGKSQTIANIIATAVREGKKVLFLAEKMAALEVVKRRLDNVGLGDLCLELHSNKANKKAALAELQRTYRIPAPPNPNLDQHAAKLSETLHKLNDYVAALHCKQLPSGVSAFDAQGKLLNLSSSGLKCTIKSEWLPSVLGWTSSDMAQRRAVFANLAQSAHDIGKPLDHPWRGLRSKTLVPSDVRTFVRTLDSLESQLDQLVTQLGKLANLLGTRPPTTGKQAATLATEAIIAAKSPHNQRDCFKHAAWRTQIDAIAKLVFDGARYAELVRKLAPAVTDHAIKANLGEIQHQLQSHSKSWFRWLRRSYWRARTELRAIVANSRRTSFDDRLAILNDLVESRHALGRIEIDDELGKNAFGSLWQGFNSDWSVLSRITAWVTGLSGDQPQRDRIIAFAGSIRDPASVYACFSEIKGLLKPTLEPLRDALLQLDPDCDFELALGSPKIDTATFKSIARRISDWRTHESHALPWSNYYSTLCQLRELGLEELSDAVDQSLLSTVEAAEQFELAYYGAILRERRKSLPPLNNSFKGSSHDRLISEFRRLDLEQIELTRGMVKQTHFVQISGVSEAPQELNVLKHEWGKKTKHLPIRQLLLKTRNAVQALKPVFMMSPMSVAQFLEPGALEFDLLVIDEASQMEPVDALGAMARAKQIVVCGDEMQLPPTNFFKNVVDGAADGGGDENGGANVAALQSILGACKAAGMRDEMLRWHYRSRHHSLIAVSNQQFYDDQLFVVPSPMPANDQLGLRFHHLPDSVYGRGGSATNPLEAKAVVAAIIRHAEKCPHKSLGVAAFSAAQRDEILDQLELQRRARPDLEAIFFNANPEEPFFVKNLENVQGDERDVIFISVGYGRDDKGKLTMEFGPLTRQGGEKRLNVLTSRAKERCEVFSQLTHHDINLANVNSYGVKSLKVFLEYAQTGNLAQPAQPMGGFESDFERAVCQEIRRQTGLEVHSQIGVAGFRIDLAVVHPNFPGCYILGIECDGAGYHSSRSARDRDRLRQQILEDRGWTIHRIWSTDWFNQPEIQLKNAVEAIERAKRMSNPRELA